MSKNSVETGVEGQSVPAARLMKLLCLLLMTGCAGVERAPPADTTAVRPAETRPADTSIGKTEPPAAKIPAKVPASPVVAEPTRKQGTTPAPVKKEAAPPLDLTMLETRLKETKAIGVFTKITLKNQVDDLLERFRSFYQGRTRTTLAELRQPYESLILKVLALLQDGDPDLARTIVASREAIWGILADPKKFATL